MQILLGMIISSTDMGTWDQYSIYPNIYCTDAIILTATVFKIKTKRYKNLYIHAYMKVV